MVNYMKYNDLLSLIYKNIISNKKNISYLIIFSILSFLTVLVLVFKDNLDKIIFSSLNSDINYRTISIIKEDNVNVTLSNNEIENILSIDHVVEYFEGVDRILYVKSDIVNNYLDGSITLLRGSSKSLPTVIEGKKFFDDDEGVIICPKWFYPNSDTTNINKDALIDGSSLLDDFVEIIYYERNYDNYGKIVLKNEYKKKYKVIGLYDVGERMNDNATCYLPAQEMHYLSTFENAYMFDDYYVPSYNILIDDVKYVDDVMSNLSKYNYFVLGTSSHLDYDTIDKLNLSIIVIISIIVIVIMILSSLFYKKKLLYQKKDIAVFVSLGYSNSDIYKIFVLENLFVSLISFVLGLVIFFIVYSICITNIGFLISAKMMINGFSISLISILITFMIIVLIPSLFSYLNIRKFCKLDVSKMFGD